MSDSEAEERQENKMIACGGRTKILGKTFYDFYTAQLLVGGIRKFHINVSWFLCISMVAECM